MDQTLPPTESAEHEPVAHLLVDRRPRSRRRLLAPIVSAALVLQLALVIALWHGERPVLYRAECVVQLAREPGAGQADSQEWYATQRYLLTSSTLADRVVAALQLDKQRGFFGLTAKEPLKKTPREASEKLLAHLTIQDLDQTRLVRVRYDDTDPKRAARVANLLVEQYLQKSMEDRADSVQRGMTFLAQQIDKTKQRLTQVEGELQAYVERTPSAGVSFVAQQQLVLAQVTSLEQELTRARLATITLAARANKLKEAQRADPFEIHSAEVDDNAQVKTLRAAHLDAALKYQEAAATEGAGSKPAEQMRSRLDNLRDQLQTTIEGIVRAAQAELQQAQVVEQQLGVELKKVNAVGHKLQLDELAHGRATRERAATEELLTKLQAQATTAGVADATGAQASIVEPAVVPSEPLPRGLF